MPSPKPTILTPPDLELTTGTAEIFRLPEVQETITGNFVVLPCDLVCELSGSLLLEAWMTLQGQIPGSDSHSSIDNRRERQSRAGGLGVWYETRDTDEGGVGVKKEETDFLSLTEMENPLGTKFSASSLKTNLQNVVLHMTKDTLSDKMDEQKNFRVRKQLLAKHGKVRMLTNHRDAHIYFFPQWVKHFMARNDTFESIGEDVVGWWAKCRWQSGLSRKLGIDEALRGPKRRRSESSVGEGSGDVDLASLSSTNISDLSRVFSNNSNFTLSSKLQSTKQEDSESRHDDADSQAPHHRRTPIPPILGYLHQAHTTSSPSSRPQPLIRRIDTVPLLLSCSLYLARQADSPKTISPFAHPHQIHPTTTVPSHTTIHPATVLIDANVSLSQRITLRECVVGANCSIASGARLTRCVLMEGALVEEKVVLHGCVLGRRCRVGKGSELRDCSVQEAFSVAEGTAGKNEVMAGFAEDGELDEDEEGDTSGDIDV